MSEMAVEHDRRYQKNVRGPPHQALARECSLNDPNYARARRSITSFAAGSKVAGGRSET